MPAALKRGDRGDEVRRLQQALRALGYLRNGIDGVFGRGTERSVKAVQYDLMRNDGGSATADGDAPVAVKSYNRRRVREVNGRAGPALLACIADMMADDAFPKLPSVPDPVAANRRVGAAIRKTISDGSVPVPAKFVEAILRQESAMRHFNEPGTNDEDRFLTMGLDPDPRRAGRIRSRGYGIGQVTLFHHPPTVDELRRLATLASNLRETARILRDKFDHFVRSFDVRARADDRHVEYGDAGLRQCKYAASDPRYMQDCANCALTADAIDIKPGKTPLYKGSRKPFNRAFHNVPRRDKIGCDWPYAVRRYNGGGVNSYNYQASVLGILKTLVH